MEKPDVDSIDGLSPAISIDQKTTSRNPRSTVGTVDGDLRLPSPSVRARGTAALPDLRAGRSPGQSIESIVDQVLRLPEGTKFTVNAPVVRDRKGEYKDLLEHLRGEGFTRVKVDGEQRMLDEEIELDKKFKHTIEVVVDRLSMKSDLRHRLTDSVETALALAEGLVTVDVIDGEELTFSERFACPEHGVGAARTAAAHLQLQLAARRLPALHRARRAAGDRPRPPRPRPRALDRRGCARPVVGRELDLLRVGHPGDRRPLRDRHRQALARAHARSSRTSSSTARAATRSTSRTATAWAEGAPTCSPSRASSRASSAATRRPTPRRSASESRST